MISPLFVINKTASWRQILPSLGDVFQRGFGNVSLNRNAFLAGDNNVTADAELVNITQACQLGPVQIGASLARHGIQSCQFIFSGLRLAASRQQQQSNSDSLGLAQRPAFARSVLTPGASGFFIQ